MELQLVFAVKSVFRVELFPTRWFSGFSMVFQSTEDQSGFGIPEDMSEKVPIGIPTFS